MGKTIGFKKIKQQKDTGDDRVIDTIFQERIGRGCQKTEIPAEQNERWYIPTHNEHADRGANDRHAYKIDIPQIFRGEEQWISTKSAHERAVHGAEKDEPEQ